MHVWRRNPDGSATCQKCKGEIDPSEAARCFRGEELPVPTKSLAQSSELS
jgi:hypothetical protein